MKEYRNTPLKLIFYKVKITPHFGHEDHSQFAPHNFRLLVRCLSNFVKLGNCGLSYYIQSKSLNSKKLYPVTYWNFVF